MTLLLRTVLLFAGFVGLVMAQGVPRPFGLHSGQPLGQPLVKPSSQPIAVDRIVAVVNDEVITLHDLRTHIDSAQSQLQRQNMVLPPRDVLEKQMLERLVIDKVQLQYAKETGVKVDDAQLDQALQRIATGNKLSPGQFRAALEKDGVVYTAFREEIRSEMTIARVREREVENKIVISEGEIDNYLANLAAPANTGEEYQLAHILLSAPESASPEQLQKLRAKADGVRERLHKGEGFVQLAAAYSDAPDALKGGDLGWRSPDRLPPMFAEVSATLKVGEVSQVLRSSNGFHLIKLLAKRSGGVAAVEQTHARHILVKTNDVVSETEARRKIESMRERVVHGESFVELAKFSSQDASASKGGDLGWIYPGDTLPEFERAMSLLAPGEISEPVQTPFGIHLIEVLERRVQDVSSERQRAAAKQALRERKRDEAYQDWLRQARDRAYVELRLEEN